MAQFLIRIMYGALLEWSQLVLIADRKFEIKDISQKGDQHLVHTTLFQSAACQVGYPADNPFANDENSNCEDHFYSPADHEIQDDPGLKKLCELLRQIIHIDFLRV